MRPITLRRSLSALLVTAAAIALSAGTGARSRRPDPPGAERAPNVVIVFADDMGYADLSGYGGPRGLTPNLDRMAAEGVRFTSFYVAQAVCSASRAALLTGAYPNRVGIRGALFPDARVGLDPGETTIAEVLKARGYATAIVGKWHLGSLPQFLPTVQGFDEYYGLPYSNDMYPGNPYSSFKFPDLPLLDGTRPVELNPDQDLLTARYTDRAVRFIERNAARPFFLYLAHSMPHVPLHVGADFRGRSGYGLYGDVVSEMDWSVGRVLETLRRLDLDSRTLVLFTSDNGPWLIYGNHAGSAGPLREGKGTTFEGGVRVPAVARWPGHIPPGRTVDALATTMDLLPTIAGLADAPVGDRAIDGLDIWPLLSGQSSSSPHEAFYYYWLEGLQAVRSGRWKLHLPHAYDAIDPPAGRDGRPSKYARRDIGLSLFDLDTDVGETTDVAAAHPDVVARLEAIAERARADLGDSTTKRTGAHVRPPGRVEP